MLQESEISVKNIHQDIFPKTPPWIPEKPEVILKLNELPKQKPHPYVIFKESPTNAFYIYFLKLFPPFGLIFFEKYSGFFRVLQKVTFQAFQMN